jgi:hypothetical protein
MARSRAISSDAPRIATTQDAGAVWARTPSAFATATPRKDPMMPTTTFARIPI